MLLCFIGKWFNGVMINGWFVCLLSGFVLFGLFCCLSKFVADSSFIGKYIWLASILFHYLFSILLSLLRYSSNSRSGFFSVFLFLFSFEFITLLFLSNALFFYLDLSSVISPSSSDSKFMVTFSPLCSFII